MTRPAPHTPPDTATPPLPPARVLVVDPDAEARCWTDLCLRPQGHEVHTSADADLIEQAPARGFDLVLMDPAARAGRGTRHGHDAWQRLRGLRDQTSRLPVLVLQARSDAADRTVALELGADAVLDKPFEPRELRARVTALLRRHRDGPPPAPADALRFGPWSLDLAQRCLLSPTGLRVPLSPAECRLLHAFLRRPQHTLSRSQLLDLARGEGVEQLDRSIDLLVSRLRHKLQDPPRAPQLIRTVRGVGYLFDALQEAVPPVSRQPTR